MRILCCFICIHTVHLVLRYSRNSAQYWLDRQSPRFNSGFRVGLSVLVALTYMFGFYYYDNVIKGLYKPNDSVPSTLIVALLFALISTGLQLAIEATEQSRFLALENEMLKQEQLQARYEGLKHQLSPHFLFNSLSTLSGLIHDEPAAAGQFVEEMSSVYRYLLRYGERNAVPLREELAFLHSYVYLLKMRFGQGLELQLQLPENIYERLLPPLALQLLVENAVKHNALTRRQPLTITIEFQAPATLVVRNTHRPRLTPEPSSGVGLSNLTTRIWLLHRQELLVDNADGIFSVYVPLPA